LELGTKFTPLSEMRNRLERALARRGERAEQAREVCRLVAGDADQLPGWVVDRLGEYAFVTCNDSVPPEALADLEWLAAQLGLKGMTLRRRSKGGRGQEVIAMGEAVPERLELWEGPARVVLRIQPESLSYGLFPDLRLERLGLGDSCQGRAVLNLYAYSGLFGVHAALSGATRVVQVDALKSTLAMIKANELVNGITTARVHEDALLYCRRAARRGDHFDVVIHDPPTFGRDPKGRARSTKKELTAMLAASMSAVAPGGLLLSVVNTASLSAGAVNYHHRSAADLAGCRLKRLADLRVDDTAPSPLKGAWFRCLR
jgi:23S rRNA (cytosine1962-C5)-methyltransferase